MGADVFGFEADADAEALGGLREAYQAYRRIETARRNPYNTITGADVIAAARVMASAAEAVLDRFLFTGHSGPSEETSVTDPGAEYITDGRLVGQA